MVRRVSKKQRGIVKRRQKKIVLMGAEGKNQTERKYFESFNRIQDEYRVIFSNGSHTDPEGVIKDLIKSAKLENLDEDYGDLKVCMLDVDYPGYREKKLKAAIKISEEKNVQLYLSNPCFEYGICFILNTVQNNMFQMMS